MSQTLEQPHLDQLRNLCSTCSLSRLCVPMGLAEADVEQLDNIVQQGRPLRAGEHLFRANDPFNAIYAVRSGCFKSYIVDSEGHEQVLGFHLPGELLGLDAIYPEHHRCSAVALDTGSVCTLPYSQLTQLAARVPGLQSQIFRLLSKDISNYVELAADHTADERLAGFLLSLSARFRRRGYSATRFRLIMPRRDIANYLRLATETISRVLARFQHNGLIQVERRDVELLDLDGLRRTAGSLHIESLS